VSRYAEPMARLIEELKKLPGVGTKSAQRFAFHILRSTDDDADALADAVRGLKASLRLCSICNNVTDVDPCAYCASPTQPAPGLRGRGADEHCAVERGRAARRLPGRLSMCCTERSHRCTAWALTSCGPATLLARVERGEVDEVILATSPTARRRGYRQLAGNCVAQTFRQVTGLQPACPRAATSNTPTK
jgi:recombination protein RecR